MAEIVIRLDDAEIARLEEIAAVEHQSPETVALDAIRLFLAQNDSGLPREPSRGDDYVNSGRQGLVLVDGQAAQG